MVTTDRTRDGKDAALIPHEMDNQPLAPTQATIWPEVPTEFASIYGGRTHRILSPLTSINVRMYASRFGKLSGAAISIQNTDMQPSLFFLVRNIILK